MVNSRQQRSWLLTIIFVAVASTSIYCQYNPLVDIKAQLHKGAYYIGEPIFMEMKIKNISPHFLEFTSIFNPRGDVEIKIRKPGHLTQKYVGQHPVAFYPMTVYELLPGQSRSTRFIIHYQDDAPVGLVFDEPQRAAIQVKIRYNIVKYEKQADRTTKDILRQTRIVLDQEVEFKEPQGKDKEALDLILNKSCMADIHAGAAREENKKTFQKLVEQYPDSLYAPYCLYALAGGETSSKNPQPDNEKAISLFKELIKKYPGFYLKDTAYYRIAGAYDTLKEEQETTRWLARLYSQFPESPLIAKNDPYFWRYFFKKYDPMINPPDPNWMLFQPPAR